MSHRLLSAPVIAIGWCAYASAPASLVLTRTATHLTACHLSRTLDYFNHLFIICIALISIAHFAGMDVVVKRKSYSATRSASANPSNRSTEKRFSMTDRTDQKANHSVDLEFQKKRSLLDLRPRQAFSKDEYVDAMVEDLCDWLNFLYELRNEYEMNPATFFQQLADGVILNRHATVIHSLAENYLQTTSASSRALPMRVGCKSIKVPERPPTWVQVDFSKKINDFHRRDNVANFITWCRDFNIPIGMTFETEDLVSQKNLRNVVVCLLEIARIGRLFGMEVPDIIQLEEDIDMEVSGGQILTNEVQPITERKTSTSQDEDQIDTTKVVMRNKLDMSHITIRKPSNLPRFLSNEYNSDSQQPDFSDTLDSFYGKYQRHSTDLVDSNRIDNSDTDSVNSHGSTYKIPNYRTVKPIGRVKIYDCFDQKNLVRERKYREKCDMRSLDERVREILSECQCNEMFPMKRISEGRYQWGDKKSHIFVRILRNHVMVRVGGGWDTLNEFLRKHDHCRKDRNVNSHRSLVAPPIRKLLKPSPVCSNDLKSVPTGISQNNGFLIPNKIPNRRGMLTVSHLQKLSTEAKSQYTESFILVQQSTSDYNKEISENKENSCLHKKIEQSLPSDDFSHLKHIKSNFTKNRPWSCQSKKDLTHNVVTENSPEFTHEDSDIDAYFSENEERERKSKHTESPPQEREYQPQFSSDKIEYVEKPDLIIKPEDESPQTNQKSNKILSRIPVLKKR